MKKKMVCYMCGHKAKPRGNSMNWDTLIMPCPKCHAHASFVGCKTPYAKRLKIETSIVRDIIATIIMVSLAMLHSKYSADAFDGTLVQRVFNPLTPGVVFVAYLAWMHRYLHEFWCGIVKGGCGRWEWSGGRRFLWASVVLLATIALCVGAKKNVVFCHHIVAFIREAIASPYSVGVAFVLFFTQEYFGGYDFWIKLIWSRDAHANTAGSFGRVPSISERAQCYAVCITLTVLGIGIVCAPSWFSGTALGDSMGKFNQLFGLLYGLIGGVVSLAISLLEMGLRFVVEFIVPFI